MAAKRTKTSCYESAYGGGWISSSQKLAEIMAERIAGASGNTGLPPFFWKQSNWEKVFVQQITQANRLVKAYSYEAVFRALQRKETSKVRSFGAPWLKDIVADEQAKIEIEDKLRESAYIPEAGDVNSRPREQQRNNKSLRSKLDNNYGKKQEGGSSPG